MSDHSVDPSLEEERRAHADELRARAQRLGSGRSRPATRAGAREPAVPVERPDPIYLHTQPRARNEHPETSHEAAASISLESLSKRARMILDLFDWCGPMTDEQSLFVFERTYPTVATTPGGHRTARTALAKVGLVVVRGHDLTAAGNRAQLWGRPVPGAEVAS